jgi:hypothetical protein
MSIKAYRGNTKPVYKGEDYTDKIINNWKVLGEILCYKSPSGKTYHTKWLCQCLCNSSPKMVDKLQLLKGSTKGCYECVGERYSGNQNQNWRGYENIPSSLITRIKHGAKSRGIKYSLTNKYLNDLWIASNNKCSISGIYIEMSGTASLDRIDSSKGYVPGNVQWVHKNINIMKRSIDQKEFINLCRLIADNWKA